MGLLWMVFHSFMKLQVQSNSSKYVIQQIMQRLCAAESSGSPTPLSCITLCKLCSTVHEQGTNAKTHLINVLSTDSLPKALSEGIVNISHQNLSWKNHPTKAEIYGELPPISKTVAQRRTRFVGHYFRAKDQVISDLLLWRLPCSRRGNRPLTYPDILARDTGLVLNELG